MIETQMLKGVIEALILEIIRKKSSYGYKIVEEISLYGFTNITESTVYPILGRLRKKGLVFSDFQKSDIGPLRKYYYITEKGEEYLKSFLTDRRDLNEFVEKVFD